MNQANSGKIFMLYDRAHSGEQLFLEALRIAAEQHCVLYIVGACEAAPENDTPGWAPLPSDRVADDLIQMTRMAQNHGSMIDGCVIAEPSAEQLGEVLQKQSITHSVRMRPGSRENAERRWVLAMEQAAQAQGLPLIDVDPAPVAAQRV